VRCVGRSGRSGRIGRARTVICGARCRGFAGAATGGLSSAVFASTGAVAATAAVNARSVAAVAAVVTLCVAGCCRGAAAASLAALEQGPLRSRPHPSWSWDNCRYARRCRYRDAGCCRCCTAALRLNRSRFALVIQPVRLTPASWQRLPPRQSRAARWHCRRGRCRRISVETMVTAIATATGFGVVTDVASAATRQQRSKNQVPMKNQAQSSLGSHF